MIVAITRESFPGESRVALIPASVPALVKAGLEVRVESSAGASAGFPDQKFAESGAKVAADRADLFAADVILQVRAGGADLDRFRQGQVVIGTCDPLGDPQTSQAIAARGVTLFALEMLPRIARAQSMDVLSSMATVAGYRAVILAAARLPKMFPMLMTAAGTVRPAKVLVMGVGVAGLSAIATARRLGAVVSANDIRPAVKEQVESLGARFLQLEIDTSSVEDKGGYAKEMGEDFLRRQREMIARVIAESDVLVTTAAVPGKKAPTLVTAQMVARMAPGSVIVDLAAERGGNCELTKPGETVVSGGVSILGPVNLPSEVPYHASQMYSRNITTFLLHLLRDGRLRLDLEDEILRDTLIARDGHVVHPRVCQLLGVEPPSDAGETAPELHQAHDDNADEYRLAE
ncbi:MAG: NAD(P) transhydrogenase subunit alpha [Planctomycetes bacterium RBG_16_64_12]|nr:MAG: NAD(P) transhydrogenase subunit alpha [Planctomycetes bacterium RBG_16_64_12]